MAKPLLALKAPFKILMQFLKPPSLLWLVHRQTHPTLGPGGQKLHEVDKWMSCILPEPASCCGKTRLSQVSWIFIVWTCVLIFLLEMNSSMWKSLFGGIVLCLMSLWLEFGLTGILFPRRWCFQCFKANGKGAKRVKPGKSLIVHPSPSFGTVPQERILLSRQWQLFPRIFSISFKTPSPCSLHQRTKTKERERESALASWEDSCPWADSLLLNCNFPCSNWKYYRILGNFGSQSGSEKDLKQPDLVVSLKLCCFVLGGMLLLTCFVFFNREAK